MNTDYSFSIISEQHRQDLIAEAANDRLVKLATADRTPWWRRVGRTFAPSRTRFLATQAHPTS
jgi:hypothetical protein